MIPKFRVFDKDTKEWQSIRSIGLEEDGSILYIQCWDKYEVDIDPPYFMDNLGIDFELVQSTGLHDKKTKEIYYDDILKRDDGTLFVVDDVRTHSFLDLNIHLGYEVIGNVHEHSHLLDDGGYRE